MAESDFEAEFESKPAARCVDAAALVKGALLGTLITGGFLLVVGVLVFRQTVPQLSQAEFDVAVQRWKDHGPASYDCEILIFGNRPGDVSVQVRGGQVVKMVRDGEVPKARRAWDAWSVEGMFDTIERELEMAEHPPQTLGGSSLPTLYARFDSQLGYPQIFRRSVPGIQQEMAWEITQFKTVP